MKRLHLLLTGSSLVLIALSINRLTSLFLGHLEPMQFLRWTDFNAMLPIPLATIILYYFIKHDVETKTVKDNKRHVNGINLLFIVGVCVYGTGNGVHETMNYLHGRFCQLHATGANLCGIIAYDDDIFGHYLYYAGLILLAIALLAAEFYNRRRNPITNKDIVLIAFNASVIALAVFANLAFEPAGIDIVAFTILATLSLASIFKNRQHLRNYPVTLYLAIAYTTGILATVVCKLI